MRRWRACGTKKAGCKNKLDAKGAVADTNAGNDAFERIMCLYIVLLKGSFPESMSHILRV